MPLFHFVCTACARPLRRLISAAQAAGALRCPTPDCGGLLQRAPKPPTAQVVETLDNGFMPRKVERPAEAERLYRERARLDPLKDD